MKLSYNLQQFKNALKRNFGKTYVIYYRGNNPYQARCFYMQTKKAFITFFPTSLLDSAVIYKMAKECYSFQSLEDFLDA
jgi:hypothetical protein